MLLSQVDFLRHIKDECVFIIDTLKDKSLDDFERDAVIQRAIFRSLEIIGEATKNLDFSFRAKYPQVDWKAMAGTRDKLIHHYMDVDTDLVYDISTTDIPSLKVEVERIISIEEQQE